MESPLKTYSKIVDKHPLLGKIGTSVLLITLADVIQQCLEISKRERAPGGVATFGERARDLRDNFDWGRTSRVIAWTGLFGTPICHKWFPMLEKIIPLKGQGAPLIKRVAGRVALDQVVCSPFLTAGFLGFMSVAESGVFDGAVVESKIKDALPVLLPLSWAVRFGPALDACLVELARRARAHSRLMMFEADRPRAGVAGLGASAHADLQRGPGPHADALDRVHQPRVGHGDEQL